jgi:hypothetical protein
MLAVLGIPVAEALLFVMELIATGWTRVEAAFRLIPLLAVMPVLPPPEPPPLLLALVLAVELVPFPVVAVLWACRVSGAKATMKPALNNQVAPFRILMTITPAWKGNT